MKYIPKFPYNEEQLILNSGRVLINSKEDSIFLFSNKIINFSSNEGIHFNTEKETIINSSEIKLGLKADSPLVKGDKLKDILDKIFLEFDSLGSQLTQAIDSNGNPIPAVQTAGDSLVRSSKRLKTLLKDMNSKQNYTI